MSIKLQKKVSNKFSHKYHSISDISSPDNFNSIFLYDIYKFS